MFSGSSMYFSIRYTACKDNKKYAKPPREGGSCGALKETAGRYSVEDQTNGKTSKTTGKVKPADSWGVVLMGDKYVGSNLLGRLLMELRDNGKLNCNLPDVMFGFLDRI